MTHTTQNGPGFSWQRTDAANDVMFDSPRPARSVIVETDGDVYLVPVGGTDPSNAVAFFLAATAGMQFNVQHVGIGADSTANLISLF